MAAPGDFFNLKDDRDDDDIDSQDDDASEKKFTIKHKSTLKRFNLEDSDSEEEEELGREKEKQEEEKEEEEEEEEDGGKRENQENSLNTKSKSTPATTRDSRFQLSDDDDDNDEQEDSMIEDNSDTVPSDQTPLASTASGSVKNKKLKKTVKPLTPEALAEFQKAVDKTGIVYISRVPPFMKPQKLSHMLGKFGEIGRVYLAPEDTKIATRRKKYGGNKKKNFTEGWIEFKDKKIAKQVALLLNTTPMGGNKRNYYHDDLWNIKYLPKFKWHHLTERIAYEKASRQQRLRTEIAQAQRENKAYMASVERGKMVANMEEKKRKRKEEGKEDTTEKVEEIRRTFKQRKLVTREAVEGKDAGKAMDKVEPAVQSVLGKVFGDKR